MITGLDHAVILVSDIAAGELAYQTLFARTPAWRNTGDGADRVLFTLDNMTLWLHERRREIYGNSPRVVFAARTFSTPIAIAAVRCGILSALARAAIWSKARSRI